MSRLSPEDKLIQKKQQWLERTAKALSMSMEEAEQLLSIPRKQAVRLNPLVGETSKIFQAMIKLGWVGDKFDWLENGYSIEDGLEKLRDSEHVKKGEIYIQNPASWVAVLALNPLPGENILDACAAPGGKTSHIAAVTNNQARITANDNSRPRLAKLKANCERLNSNVQSYTLYDATRLARKLEGEQFDKILLDAPCSGEGMMCLPVDKDFSTWSVAHVKRMQSLQKQIIKQVWQLLKPEGTLIYSTCTIAPEENEAVVDYAIRKLEGVEVAKLDMDFENRANAVTSWNGKGFNHLVNNCLRLKPSKEMHAFFVAKLIKISDS